MDFCLSQYRRAYLNCARVVLISSHIGPCLGLPLAFQSRKTSLASACLLAHTSFHPGIWKAFCSGVCLVIDLADVCKASMSRLYKVSISALCFWLVQSISSQSIRSWFSLIFSSSFSVLALIFLSLLWCQKIPPYS